MSDVEGILIEPKNTKPDGQTDPKLHNWNISSGHWTEPHATNLLEQEWTVVVVGYLLYRTRNLLHKWSSYCVSPSESPSASSSYPQERTN